MAVKTKTEELIAARRALWAKRIGQWERSGRAQRVFCKERDWAVSTLQYWRARLKRAQSQGAGPRPAFVPLAISGSQGGALEIVLRSGTRVRLEGSAVVGAVDRLIARLK
jgi:hypothetical protein